MASPPLRPRPPGKHGDGHEAEAEPPASLSLWSRSRSAVRSEYIPVMKDVSVSAANRGLDDLARTPDSPGGLYEFLE